MSKIKVTGSQSAKTFQAIEWPARVCTLSSGERLLIRHFSLTTPLLGFISCVSQLTDVIIYLTYVAMVTQTA